MRSENKLDSHLAAYTGNNIYDFDNQIMLTWYAKRIVHHHPEARSVMELGLGHGFSTKLFSDHYPRIVVLDGSSTVIDHFRSKHPDSTAQIVETYFEEFETEERFDLIILGFVLEHVDDPVAILKRFKGFLKPQGRLYVSVPNAQVINRRLGNITGMLPDILSLSENDVLLGHRRYYTVGTLTKDVEAAGLKVEFMEGIYLKPFMTSQMLSLNLSDEFIQALCTLGVDYPELSCGILTQLKSD
jgi:trans-aconitate methyltransferase